MFRSKLIVGAEEASVFGKKSINDVIVKAIDDLESSGDESVSWNSLNCIVGDFCPEEAISKRLKTIVASADLARISKTNFDNAVAALYCSSRLARHWKDDDVLTRLEHQLIQVAKCFPSPLEPDPSGKKGKDLPAGDSSFKGTVFLEIALNLVSARRSTIEIAGRFAELLQRLASCNTELAEMVKPFVKHFAANLPVDDARQFWALYSQVDFL